MLAQVISLMNSAAVPAADLVETTQAAPSWPLIVVLAIAMMLAWRPREKAANRRIER